MPDLHASAAPGSWMPVTNVTCVPPEASAIVPQGASYEHMSEFHDHEGFTTFFDIKPFVIMKQTLRDHEEDPGMKKTLA
jgi:hypothetical protein